MKIKKLIGFTVPILLLFGACSFDKVNIKSESKPLQESKAESKSKIDKVKPVDVGNYSIEEYINTLSDIALEMEDKVTEMDNLLIGEDLPLHSKYKYLKLAEESIDLSVQARELKVPKEFAEVHKDVDRAMQMYSTGFQYQIDYVKKSDPKNSNKAIEVITEAGNLWVETSERLGKEYSKVVLQ
ncbi:hypothetical protein COK25_29795 [Bacillus cereus]|uniref:hypothetical protein n=1 Tax=Bacillus cereus group TaxID=86661 RepID=UPI000BEE0747|nr:MULTISPECIES: hypothetical protein [Bacillus cereus group]WIK99025.1 hypothetical protein QPL86_30980 [Bacillus bombysepticus]PEA92780.1 hypothetical protein CON66_27800 [Bacillus cereus]PED34457.1 hypothetical protein CON24_30335 [Bacillus cereus]PEF50200.1 hypothetical protein CON56_22945 [Bacillus thuringiensis]PEG03352.1 hypothetical protein CON54_18845 [Bacillus cereus]